MAVTRQHRKTPEVESPLERFVEYAADSLAPFFGDNSTGSEHLLAHMLGAFVVRPRGRIEPAAVFLERLAVIPALRRKKLILLVIAIPAPTVGQRRAEEDGRIGNPKRSEQD